MNVNANYLPVEKRVGTDQFLDKIADIPKHESFNKVSIYFIYIPFIQGWTRILTYLPTICPGQLCFKDVDGICIVSSEITLPKLYQMPLIYR